ncbi:MAG: hypothetical protein HOW73_00700 [Polyangiaceae bacterium]|nr:hypothetical protein [Polyangiaceae bacterium]
MTTYTAKTTSPSIEINNLNGHITQAEKQLTTKPDDLGARSKLVGYLLLRGRVLGKSTDLARAHTLAEESVTVASKGPEPYILRARGRAAIHRFTDALADLDMAEKELPAKASTDPILGQRASIFVAVGRYDEALPLMEKRTKSEPSTTTFGDYAALLGKLGRYKEAEDMFLQAELKFRSLSPIPLVELYFDRAQMWERAGNLDQATKLYRAALKRFAQHVHVATHIATLIPPTEAIAILEPLTSESDDADLFAQLGVLKNLLEKGTGDADIAKAKTLYDARYAEFPYAYADHAGWFWTNAGGDPQKALACARKNLEERRTPEAYELLFAAANAADDKAAKCEAKTGASALKVQSPRIVEQLKRLEGKVECASAGITPPPQASASASTP